MLESTKQALMPLFTQLGEISAKIGELKEDERAKWEEDPEADPSDWETLEELEDILIGLPAMLDEEDEED